ncbi:MAG: GtrA family protein [Clostridia bacterium]|nr:GtrA family protein [Clostridia bacterium]
MKTIKNLIIKYKELIIYGIFGVGTTLVNFLVYELFNMLLGVELYWVSNIIAWFVSVVFAYVTNKLFVFESKKWDVGLVLKEASSFFAARVFSLLVEQLGLVALVDLAGMKDISWQVLGFTVGGETLAKVVLAAAVVVLNYVFSKLVVFRKKK